MVSKVHFIYDNYIHYQNNNISKPSRQTKLILTTEPTILNGMNKNESKSISISYLGAKKLNRETNSGEICIFGETREGYSTARLIKQSRVKKLELRPSRLRLKVAQNIAVAV